jgi:hypothetical protein
VIARLQQREDRRRDRSHAGSECARAFCAFDGRDGLLCLGDRRIAPARVVAISRGDANLLLVVFDLESGSLINGRGDRTVLFLEAGSPVHGGGRGIDLLFHVCLAAIKTTCVDSARASLSAVLIYNSRSLFMDLGLKNRVALVAASSQGIGLATAEAFAVEGCRVAMCARNNQTLQAAAEKIREQHKAEVFTEAFDVSDPTAVSRFVAAVAGKFGGVDICVTNAGGPPAKGFLAASLEDWKHAIDANFLSTVYFAREVIPYMQEKRWGRISLSRQLRRSSRLRISCFRTLCEPQWSGS